MKPIVVSLLAFSLCIFSPHAADAQSGTPLLQPELSGHPPPPKLPKGQVVKAPADMVTGTVLETMDSGGYTYVRVKVEEQDLWAAGATVAVKVGDTVSFSKGMEMRGFRSESLQRTFDSIYFVEAIQVGAPTPAGAAPHANQPGANPHTGVGSTVTTDMALTGIAPAEGGKTVREVYEEKELLSGKEVLVHAKVVKATFGVMKKNWFHLRDGTESADGENDLTVTSMDTAAVGDIVFVRGNVATDKDFGFGYHYDLMIEDAKITSE